MNGLELLIDGRLTWLPTVKALRTRHARVLQGVQQHLARRKGCAHEMAQRVFRSMASAAVLYALPLAYMGSRLWQEFEIYKLCAICLCLGLPSTSPLSGTYTEAGTWPIEMRALQTRLRHIKCLMNARDGAALRQRYP